MIQKRSNRLKKAGTSPVLSHLEIVADRSGSMQSMKNVPIQKLKELIKEQTELSLTMDNKIELSLTTFDNVSVTWYENKDVKELVDISDEKWKNMMNPPSTKRMIDTIYERAKAQSDYIKEYIRNLPLEVKKLNPVIKSTLIVYTDGLDNISKRSSRELNVLLTELQDKGMTAIFLGANQDAIMNGVSMGFNENTTMTIGSSPEHTGKAMSYVNNMCRALSSDGDGTCRPSFSKKERESSKPLNYVSEEVYNSEKSEKNNEISSIYYTGECIKDQWNIMKKKFVNQNDKNFNIDILPPPPSERLSRSVVNPVPKYSNVVKEKFIDNGYPFPLSSPVSRTSTPILNHSILKNNNNIITPEEIAANSLVSMAMKKAIE
tara:strand:- start:90 stop:1217 length:1128 start_codon:yes stop_codon:yes gene_type:complete